MSTYAIASDLSYEVLHRRLSDGQMRTPDLSRENQERLPQSQTVPIQPRPAFFNPDELRSEPR